MGDRSQPSLTAQLLSSPSKGVIMSSKLWFVTNGAQLIAVFNNRDKAEREMMKYQDDPDFAYYDFYGLTIDELDDYPEEYDIALDEGYVD